MGVMSAAFVPGDFRVHEQGVPQRVTEFAEDRKPPLSIAEDGTGRSLTSEDTDGGAGVPRLGLEDSENSYGIAYHPSQSR